MGVIRLGLSGGIGAGKSTVAKTFIERGAYLIDADKIAREVVEPGTPGLAALVEAFGAEILTDDGSLDRPALAAKAFVDEEQRQKLNAITHPLVGARTRELLEAAPDDAIVVQDIPLLVEGNMAPFFHLVVMVHADAETRVERLTTARGMPEDDARARIAAQATDEQRRAVSDVWMDNSGTTEDLANAAATLWSERLVAFERNVRARRPAQPLVHLVAADPDPSTLGTRLVNRLWAILGDKATAITQTATDTLASEAETLGLELSPADLTAPEVSVTLAPAVRGVAELLADGGFPRVDGEVDVYASADPGRPGVVRTIVG
ncbi:dephospho-CoA kinase [Gordonia rhizosphera NBRC 16068]|uniref:Dephospho-CoA kinase n=1 Tax=Gordonia rhizosphera NBRC 16068 TaxID=1108045 RepID=K6WIB8_9ACTN|nr:dephospho-CoA kinase [Gordonia rhizosphera NBRC 16068]